MEELTSVFEPETDDGQKHGARSLEGTAQLTQVASGIAADIFKTLESEMPTYREQVAASQKSHAAMDELITSLVDFDNVDVAFLRDLPEETVDAMLKSQQSKRSRTKSKTMTLDNYRSMMVGAIAENLIRFATGKSKQAGGSRRAAGEIGFNEEQLAFLAENQDELKRELRNIQSKKSIAKSKEGFSETDDYWLKLLEAEADLKAIRVSTGRTRTVEVDKTREALAELDVEHMSKKELAEAIKALASDKQDDTE